jgi:hypothetical protein
MFHLHAGSAAPTGYSQRAYRVLYPLRGRHAG